jgi:hypothetical protein
MSWGKFVKWLKHAKDKVVGAAKSIWGKFLKPVLKAVSPYAKAIGAGIGAAYGGAAGAQVGAQIGQVAGTIGSDLANGNLSSAVENAKTGIGLVQPKPSQSWIANA